MNTYITTNIRLNQDDYFRLKEEAVKKRKSFAAVIREKIATKKTEKSPVDMIKLVRKHATQSSKYLEGVDIVETLHNARYNSKW